MGPAWPPSRTWALRWSAFNYKGEARGASFDAFEAVIVSHYDQNIFTYFII